MAVADNAWLATLFDVYVIKQLHLIEGDGSKTRARVHATVDTVNINSSVDLKNRRNVVRYDLDLYFQGHTISENHIIFNIWKAVRASENAQEGLL